MRKTAFITGASAGIGHALALELASRGYQLALAARSEAALAELAGTIAAKHPELQVETRVLDVNDSAAVRAAVMEFAASFGSLELVVANAGIGDGGGVGMGKFAAEASLIQTNVIGAMATVDAGVELFRKQGSGQVVAIASVAAFRGVPGAASYCASKAAIATYMQAVRAELYHSKIRVTTLFPGYIDTDMNRAMKSRPFLIDTTTGARQMADMIERGVQESTVPVMPWAIVGRLMKWAPLALIARQKPFEA